tara:strand:- start:59616 stop:60080 length:465 start_codon:yes stop_codon:yes gene_type:complete
MWWRQERKEVAAFLYELLVSDSPKGYARSIAESMDVPYPTLSKYWLGKRRFPASLIKPLFHATGQDARVAEFFLLDGSDYQLERKNDQAPPNDLGRAVLLLGKLEGRISDLYLQATEADSEEGHAISPTEAAQLHDAIRSLIAQADKLRVAFKI